MASAFPDGRSRVSDVRMLDRRHSDRRGIGDERSFARCGICLSDDGSGGKRDVDSRDLDIDRPARRNRVCRGNHRRGGSRRGARQSFAGCASGRIFGAGASGTRPVGSQSYFGRRSRAHYAECIFPSAQDALTSRRVGNRIFGFEIYMTEEFSLLTANGKRSNISGVEPETVSGKTHQRK